MCTSKGINPETKNTNMTSIETLLQARLQARRALDRAECGSNQYAINAAFIAYDQADQAFQAARNAAEQQTPAVTRALEMAD